MTTTETDRVASWARGFREDRIAAFGEEHLSEVDMIHPGNRTSAALLLPDVEWLLAETSRLQGVLDGYRARLVTEAEEANARSARCDPEARDWHYEDGRVNGLCRALSLLDEAREGKR